MMSRHSRAAELSWLAVRGPHRPLQYLPRGATGHRYPAILSHVTARTGPARTNQDMVRLCAMCHSNPAVRGQVQSPRYHRQLSVQLSWQGHLAGQPRGRQLSGLPCRTHAQRPSDQARTDTSAPPTVNNLPDTCRQPACHRAAGATHQFGRGASGSQPHAAASSSSSPASLLSDRLHLRPVADAHGAEDAGNRHRP